MSTFIIASRSVFKFSFGCGYYEARDIIRRTLREEGYREKFLMSGESVWENIGMPFGAVKYIKATYTDTEVNISAWVSSGGFFRGAEEDITGDSKAKRQLRSIVEKIKGLLDAAK